MSKTLEQMIAYHEECAKFAERNNVPEWQEEHEQYVALLRELAERRKEPEIIRCKNCAKRHKLNCPFPFGVWEKTPDDGYCYIAERKTDESATTAIEGSK